MFYLMSDPLVETVWLASDPMKFQLKERSGQKWQLSRAFVGNHGQKFNRKLNQNFGTMRRIGIKKQCVPGRQMIKL